MTDPNGVIDFADPAAIGTHLIKQLRRFGALESITPGMTFEWGIQIGSRVFVLTARVARPDEVSS